MAIVYYHFPTPLQLEKISMEEVLNSLIFAQKKEVPAGYKIDLTPPGYRDKYVLRTSDSPNPKREDTVGKIEITQSGGKKISHVRMGVDGEGGTLFETEEKTQSVDLNKPGDSYVIARPLALDGGTGCRVDGVVLYQQNTTSFM